MRRFDYSFLDNGLLPANLINLTGSIYSLKTMSNFRKEDYENVFTELEKIAIVQSVKSSNAIEGIVTSDERIKQIVDKTTAPKNHNEAEIAGYRDALNEIHLNYFQYFVNLFCLVMCLYLCMQLLLLLMLFVPFVCYHFEFLNFLNF